MWWQVIKDRDSRGPGLAGDPPVESREVDQDDGVGRIGLKDRLGLFDQPVEVAEHRDDFCESHHGQVGQGINQLATGFFKQRLHQRPAKTGGNKIGAPGSQFTDQPGGVFVPAGLTD